MLNPYNTKVPADRLIEKNTGLVKKYAYFYAGRVQRAAEVEDLLQVGMMGLIEAAHNYENREGVDKAEEDEELATIINGDAPTVIAQACAEMQIPLVHISSDYVFEGSGGEPWKPGDATAPQNAYGRSKLVGEEGILGSGATHAILRTSWVVSAHGANFVKTMQRLSKIRDTLSVVADQIGGPTPARDIASACLVIAQHLQDDPSKSGTYHYSGAPSVSWADFASEIFAQTSLSVTVIPITTAEYPTPAKRPLNSRMDCRTTVSTFGVKQPDWRIGLNEILKELEVTT
ncbi:dTDP-4-dehydrorhamnose reductase [Planktomarina temperata]|nr:dTDP-4-dehydrorhamnose reductase [Planktomarina temperata]